MGTLYASFRYNDEARGIAWYNVDRIVPDNDPAPPGDTFGVQYLGSGYLGIKWSFVKGTINLVKSSAAPDVTNGNPCYSLEGAVYDVYKAGGSKVGSITTDASGRGSLGNLDLGGYTVREVVAPQGYFLDPTVYSVTTNVGTPVQTVHSTDAPAGDPFLVMLQKIDSETGGPYGIGEIPQGAASLSGAEYTVNYYADIYSSVAEAQAMTPTCTWVFGTEAHGYVLVDQTYLSGDPLYLTTYGTPIIPFGTITIEETKAPTGYLLPQPGDSNYKVFLTRYIPDSSQPGGIRIEGDGNGVVQGNEPKHADRVIRGDLELSKSIYLHEPDSVVETGATAPEPNASFDFYASRDFSGTEPHGGATPAFSLTTDADGYASTVASGIYLIQNPDGTYTVTARPSEAAGGLPYDSYLCVQRTSDPAYEKCENYVYTIGANGQLVSRDAYDHVVPAFLRILKLDAESGQKIAFPATWQIFSQQTNSSVAMYDGSKTTDVFTSDVDGNLVLPQQLPYGDYLLHELIAPTNFITGYLLNPVDVPFSVTERHDIDNPLVVTMEDAPAKAIIEISKVGQATDEPVEGAAYDIIADGAITTLDGTVRALDGQTVATITTGSDGKASSDPLYLGSYIVKETVAPDGFLLDATEHRVNLLYKDQVTPLFTRTLELEDTEVFIRGSKLDKDSMAPVPNTEFTLYRESAVGADDWAEVDTLVTDADGKVIFMPVIQGSYKLVETCPNPQYASSEESGEEDTRYITIDENSTGETQVFRDEMIQISCETYKDTINITSAGFRTFDDDYVHIENVGSEQYHYTLDFRSTSNVRADEFTVVDPLTEVLTGHVRVRELFTPVTRGDSDGYFNLWYQTNHTCASQAYSSANAMDTNPDNPNNPENTQNWPSTGWQLWQQDIPTTSMMHLRVADLGLAPDEYITALRYEYGSVEVGFTTRATGKQALQQTKDLKGTFSDWSGAPKPADGSVYSALSTNLEPATYLVECSTALLPPALILGSASVHIARNVVLTDDDQDTVRTTVIEPFMMQASYTPPTDITKLDGFDTSGPEGLPVTGDSLSLWACSLAAVLLLLAAALHCLRHIQSRKGNES
jgi:hypothetical protein